MKSIRMIDGTDRKILELLQDNGRTPNAEIARRLGMAPSATFERIRKLEAQGVIQKYEARLDPRALGLHTAAFVLVRADERLGDEGAGDRIAGIPGVLEVHHIAGEDCYLVKVRTEDTDSLGRLLRERFGAIETVRSTRTTIVLGTLKESGALPIAGVSPARDGGPPVPAPNAPPAKRVSARRRSGRLQARDPGASMRRIRS